MKPVLDYAPPPRRWSRTRAVFGWILTGLMFLLALPGIVRGYGRRY